MPVTIAKLKHIYGILHKWDHLGVFPQPDGSCGIGRVPHVAPAAIFHKIYAPLVPAGSKAIASALGTIPLGEYADFLRLANGLNVFSNSLRFYGQRAHYNRQSSDLLPFCLIDPNTLERPRGVAREQLQIGSYERDGSSIWLNTSSGVVCRHLDDKARTVVNTWETLEGMLVSEVERLAKLFDESGRFIGTSNDLRLPPSSGRS